MPAASGSLRPNPPPQPSDPEAAALQELAEARASDSRALAVANLIEERLTTWRGEYLDYHRLPITDPRLATIPDIEFEVWYKAHHIRQEQAKGGMRSFDTSSGARIEVAKWKLAEARRNKRVHHRRNLARTYGLPTTVEDNMNEAELVLAEIAAAKAAKANKDEDGTTAE